MSQAAARERTARRISEPDFDDLARRVGRLSIDRRDPHRFFEERDELQAEIREIGRQLQRQGVFSEPS